MTSGNSLFRHASKITMPVEMYLNHFNEKCKISVEQGLDSFILEFFFKWAPSLDTFIVADRGFSPKSITVANSVDPDETEPSHLDLRYLH